MPWEGGEKGWVNRLYWGDNLQVMAHHVRFRGQGQVDLHRSAV